jgi:ubiquinone/menaquinone biosynthesis C-methylase UbiE
LEPEAYVDWRASDIGEITERLERRLILELLGDVSSRDILDVGCGDGALAVELCKRGARVTGVDSSDRMIEAARVRAAQHGADVVFNVAGAEHLPFPPESFDIVVPVTVLCFVEDAAPVFREMARILRPGGRLVIGELGKWNSWAAELRTLAGDAGLVAGPVRGAIYYPRWRFAARLLAPWDDRFSRLTTIGAAFLALSAVKPGTGKL